VKTAVEVVVFALGFLLVAATLGSVVRTLLLPRGVASRLSRGVFLSMRVLFRLRLGRRPTYEKSDRVLALYAPISLLALLTVWLLLVQFGFAAMFWSIRDESFAEAMILSGSSLLTLGFAHAGDSASAVLTFTEAGMGLLLLALLITYLPSLYAAFSRREAEVAKLEVRAGAPPSGVVMIERARILERLDRLNDVWETWEDWFVDIEETHTSFPALSFFRSPQPDHSWVTASGAVLDAAALAASTIDQRRPLEAELCIRAGYLALRRIADYFGIPYDPDPSPADPISITRDEFDDAYERLTIVGAPLKEREQAWVDFAGWRVNYDTVLLALATLTIAPVAPWSSDRAPTTVPRPPIFRRSSTRPRRGINWRQVRGDRTPPGAAQEGGFPES
jgi:hypothetical protein